MITFPYPSHFLATKCYHVMFLYIRYRSVTICRQRNVITGPTWQDPDFQDINIKRDQQFN